VDLELKGKWVPGRTQSIGKTITLGFIRWICQPEDVAWVQPALPQYEKT
jgi:hypothetical protein